MIETKLRVKCGGQALRVADLSDDHPFIEDRLNDKVSLGQQQVFYERLMQ